MWRSLTFLLLAATLCGCAGGSRAGVGPVADLSVERGRLYALRACAGCHAVGAQRESPNGSAPPFAVVRLRHNELSLERSLAEIARNGHYEMPPVHMTDDEIRDVTAYIQTVEPSGRGGAGSIP